MSGEGLVQSRWAVALRGSARAWALGVIAVSAVVCGLVTHLHFSHEATLRGAVGELQSLRQARAELAKGFLHITLSGQEDSPFDRTQGRTLLAQAIGTMEQAVTLNDAVDAALTAGFRASVEAFQEQLDAWDRDGTENARMAVALRVAFHDLERKSDEIDGRIQDDLDRISQRLRAEFLAVLSGAALLLTLICGLFVLTLRSREISEAALSASEDRWQFALEGSGDGVWDWNARTNRVYFSPRWKAMQGYASDELSDQLTEWETRVHPEDKERVLAALNAHLAGKTPHYESEYRLRRKDGTYAWILDRGKVINRLKNGEALRVIGTHTDVTRRRATEDRLRESEERFRRLVEDAPESIFIQAEGRFVYANKACLELLGDVQGALLGRPVLERVHEESREQVVGRIARLNNERARVPLVEETFLRKDGVAVPVEAAAIPFRVDGKDGALVFLRDIAQRKAAEAARDALQAQFLHAQKLESVGRLAGGIAHDFNNILSVINGYSELAVSELAADTPLREHIETIHGAGQRAARLTRQLLAFSRKQVLVPKAVDVNTVVADMEKMFGRVIGETITLRTELKPDLPAVHADEGQLEQVIANLVINARDAMPEGGTLSIATGTVRLETGDPRLLASMPAGDYVTLSVTDTGVGMDEETKANVFEPFFTTKAVGKGTGLGLAMVYGTVRQSEGGVTVDSAPGDGTTFTIYLPQASKNSLTALPAATHPLRSILGSETILVVEDESSIRAMSSRILEQAGYKVLSAADGQEAISMAAGYAGPIDLLFTDMVMPGMNGIALAAELALVRPEMKVLYTSGYSDSDVVQNDVLKKGVRFINKPFGVSDLLREVREVLASTPGELVTPSDI